MFTEPEANNCFRIISRGEYQRLQNILKSLEYDFLKRFLVQGRQHSFWKFSIFSNILDLEWCLSNKWKLHSATVRVVWWTFRPIRTSNSYKLNIYVCMGYWPSVRSRWLESRSINSQKKNLTNIQPSWPNKSGRDSSILPTRVANHSAGFDSSSPITELAT